jgi:hypothetical protein
MNVLPELQIKDLPGYNITTAGPTVLCTNVKRLAVPLDLSTADTECRT